MAIAVRPSAFFAKRSRAPSIWGEITGRCSWKSVSAARIATTGAEADLARLDSESSGRRRALAASVRTNVIRSGWLLSAVGVNFASS